MKELVTIWIALLLVNLSGQAIAHGEYGLGMLFQSIAIIPLMMWRDKQRFDP